MQLQQHYAYDKELAESGKRIDLGDGAFILLAMWGNRKFQSMFAKLSSQYAAGKRANLIPPETRADIILECVAKTVILDWGGIYDGDEEVPYSPENAQRILGKYERFFADICDMAQDIQVFKVASQDEDLGNSQPSSDTNSE